MHNPHNKTYLFVHAIWSAKHREPVLIKPARETLFTHMRENATEKGLEIIALNGVEDHVHCLFQLHPTQTVSTVMQILKGGSAFWMNTQKYLDKELKWQDGYAAYSVSPSMVKKVVKYIEYQEEHHRVESLDDELDVMDGKSLQNPQIPPA